METDNKTLTILESIITTNTKIINITNITNNITNTHTETSESDSDNSETLIYKYKYRSIKRNLNE